VNPTNAKTELTPASSKELAQIEGGVNSTNGDGTLVWPPIKGSTGPTYPTGPILPTPPLTHS
jgi:hypothetical protein